MAERKRFIFVDVLNVIACIAVIILHVSLEVFDTSSGRWSRALLLQSLAIFAVPVFFMISGMNLIGYRDKYSTEIFFRKRLWKVGRALILASVFCYLLFCLFPHSFYGAQGYAANFGVVDFIGRFFTNSINDIYWFLYVIIYLYVITPLLSLAKDNRILMQYLLILSFAVSICFPFMMFCGIRPEYLNTLFNWPLFTSSAMFYYLLGYYIVHFIEQYPPIWIPMVGIVLSVIAMFLGGLIVNGYFSGQVNHTYQKYLVSTSSPLCVLEALCLFMLLASLEKRFVKLPERATGLIRKISAASFGVYLFHILIIDWAGASLPGRALATWNNHPLVRAAVVYVVTLAAVMIGKKAINSLKTVRQCRKGK